MQKKMIQEYKSNGSLQGSYRRPREASYTDMWQHTNLGNPVTMEVMKTPCSASIPRTKGISKPTGATWRNTASQNSSHGERQPQRQTGIQESLVHLLHQHHPGALKQLKPSTAPFILAEFPPLSFVQKVCLSFYSSLWMGSYIHWTLPQHLQLESNSKFPSQWIGKSKDFITAISRGYHSHHTVTGCLYTSEFSFVQSVSEEGTDFGRRLSFSLSGKKNMDYLGWSSFLSTWPSLFMSPHYCTKENPGKGNR